MHWAATQPSVPAASLSSLRGVLVQPTYTYSYYIYSQPTTNLCPLFATSPLPPASHHISHHSFFSNPLIDSPSLSPVPSSSIHTFIHTPCLPFIHPYIQPSSCVYISIHTEWYRLTTKTKLLRSLVLTGHSWFPSFSTKRRSFVCVARVLSPCFLRAPCVVWADLAVRLSAFPIVYTTTLAFIGPSCTHLLCLSVRHHLQWVLGILVLSLWHPNTLLPATVICQSSPAGPSCITVYRRSPISPRPLLLVIHFPHPLPIALSH